jgi:hypothetical protein
VSLRVPNQNSGFQPVAGVDETKRPASLEPDSEDPVVRLLPPSSDHFGSGQAIPLMGTRMVIVPGTGIEPPLVASPAAVAPLLGKSDYGVRDDCIAGRIPTMPRGDRVGSHHRIPVARLLDQLGIPYRIERVAC